MSDTNNKRIAKNTLLLYFRLFITMGIGLYISRIVLDILGVKDFGIYNVVGGVVTLFSLISGSLSASVSRFLTIELGLGDQLRVSRVFSVSLIIHLVLAIVVLLLAEFVATWFLNTRMNIPAERLAAANWVLQCSILVFVINMISIPYNAVIIANERMKAFAYINVAEVLIKLIGVLLLYWVTIDKLKAYSVLLLFIALIVRMIYVVYCKRHFNECRGKLTYDVMLMKRMVAFAGWNFIGSSSAILRDQGVNVAINLFCGPAVNAARGISVQVNSALNSFASNFVTALNPQIMKSYAQNDRAYMLMLIQQGARLSFYMLLVLSLPVFIETETILNFWLTTVPEHTVNFVRLILLFTLCESLSATLITAMLATGKIKKYQIIVGGIQMLNFPVSYVLLHKGFVPEVTIVVAIAFSVVCLGARLWLLRTMIGLSVKYYLRAVLGNILIVTVLSAIPPFLIYLYCPLDALRFFIIVVTSIVSAISVFYYVGCSEKERTYLVNWLYEFKKNRRIR